MIPADFCGSDFSRDARHFYAPSSRGIPADFHSPQASESLSLAWPRESNDCAAGAARTAKLARRAKGRSPESREGHPTLTPYAQSLCSRYADLLRGSPTVHPWTGVELAHIVWDILRTISATAPALLYLLHPCSRLHRPAASDGTLIARIRQLLPALLYLGHPCPRVRAKSTARGPSATAPFIFTTGNRVVNPVVTRHSLRLSDPRLRPNRWLEDHCPSNRQVLLSAHSAQRKKKVLQLRHGGDCP